MKKVLVLGGTGTMGVPLVDKLSNLGIQVDVTSRSERNSNKENVNFIKGNAHNEDFLKEVLKSDYEAIIDFMSYKTQEFKERYTLLCTSTKQYVFISSCRVYAQCDDFITENSPRLLDVSDDDEFLKTDEYSLTKARQEDILKNSEFKNWTIIRPTVTYSDIRLQLGVLEKEYWLYRAYKGRSIVFSKDIIDKITTMTTSEDVADGIVAIIDNNKAFGETYHITSNNYYSWNDILDVYLDVLQNRLGRIPNVVLTNKAVSLKNPIQKYQILYCRYYNRKFNNDKIGEFINVDNFKNPIEGLKESLNKLLDNPQFLPIDWKIEAWNDRAAKERTPLKRNIGTQKQA